MCCCSESGHGHFDTLSEYKILLALLFKYYLDAIRLESWGFGLLDTFF